MGRFYYFLNARKRAKVTNMFEVAVNAIAGKEFGKDWGKIAKIVRSYMALKVVVLHGMQF